MAATITFTPGGYRFIPGVFQYSGGVAAQPGLAIEHVRFANPVPLAEGFVRIAAHIKAAGRPLTAFCACELRSPAPFTEAGFIAFNRVYVGTLAEWGIFKDEINPVARSNVCPELDPPGEPSFHGFAFTTVAPGATPSFHISGSGEAPEGKGNYGDFIVARGDVSPSGMLKKARAVLGEMERRLAAVGANWRDTTAVQLYTVHDIHPFLGDELVRRGAVRHGLTWHFARPPVIELDYEMDCRGVALERVI
ncbi:MAG: hypothetical protein HY060_22545 [Proteobacteria bacterium]|nr:hypothetical protein [Pseudomonadota bacterium]